MQINPCFIEKKSKIVLRKRKLLYAKKIFEVYIYSIKAYLYH